MNLFFVFHETLDSKLEFPPHFTRILIKNYTMLSIQVSTWRKSDVVLTSIRRDYVVSTSIWRHFGTKCPQEAYFLPRRSNYGKVPSITVVILLKTRSGVRGGGWERCILWKTGLIQNL